MTGNDTPGISFTVIPGRSLIKIRRPDELKFRQGFGRLRKFDTLQVGRAFWCSDQHDGKGIIQAIKLLHTF